MTDNSCLETTPWTVHQARDTTTPCAHVCDTNHVSCSIDNSMRTHTFNCVYIIFMENMCVNLVLNFVKYLVNIINYEASSNENFCVSTLHLVAYRVDLYNQLWSFISAF